MARSLKDLEIEDGLKYEDEMRKEDIKTQKEERKIKVNFDNYNEKDLEKVIQNNLKLFADIPKKLQLQYTQQFKNLNKLPIYKLNKSLENWNKNYTSQLNESIKNLTNIDTYLLNNALENWKKSFTNQFNESINKFIENTYKSLSTTLIPIFKEIERIRKIQAIPLLFPYMWAIPPNFSSEKLKEFVFLTFLNLEVSQEDIDEFFISYFIENDCKELWNLYETWKPYLSEERKKIIHDVFVLISENVLDIGIFPIIIPTLVAQIDGLIIDKLGYRAGSGEKKEKVEEFLKIFFQKNLNENDDIAKSYLSANFELFSKRFFQKSEEAEKENNDFNRHLIMHGNITNYGTEANLYRTIVILDFIITVLYIENIDLEIFE